MFDGTYQGHDQAMPEFSPWCCYLVLILGSRAFLLPSAMLTAHVAEIESDQLNPNTVGKKQLSR